MNWCAVIVLISIIDTSCVFCEKVQNNQAKSIDFSVDLESAGRQLVEQGRTMVHHAVKRFMIILPAIFFKLGIAFTLLVLVTIVAVNNGFIGFLLLVVGLSSVLARLQENRHHNVVPVPFVNPLPPYSHHFIDRSDSTEQETIKLPYSGYKTQRQAQFTPTLNSYYSKYSNN